MCVSCKRTSPFFFCSHLESDKLPKASKRHEGKPKIAQDANLCVLLQRRNRTLCLQSACRVLLGPTWGSKFASQGFDRCAFCFGETPILAFCSHLELEELPKVSKRHEDKPKFAQDTTRCISLRRNSKHWRPTTLCPSLLGLT